jgi:polar amino acid transport system permease protein
MTVTDKAALQSSEPPISRRERAAARFKRNVVLSWAVLAGGLAMLLGSLGLDFPYILDRLPFLLGLRLSPDGFIQGAALTLLVTAASLTFALILGVLTALGRLSRQPVAFALATFYGSFFRGTPLLVQVLLIYLALPQFGVVLNALTAGVLALSLNYGAYLAEAIRSGIVSVPQGQREAAFSLGLPRRVIATQVIAPQAMRVVIPPAGANFISMLKDSSLVSILGMWELNFLAQSYGRATYRYMEMLIAAALIYWVMSLVFEVVQARLERRYGRGYAAQGRGN